ncbi:MAG: hypothetical protein WCG01_03135 [bacterium]
MAINKSDYRALIGTAVFFSRSDQRKLRRMKDEITIVSTVCPDYPNDGLSYTFHGELGRGISLTAQAHLDKVPSLINSLRSHGCKPQWLILVADLPELTESQKEFYHRVANSKTDYIARCESSVRAIKSALKVEAEVSTFSNWYAQKNVQYLDEQESVKETILLLARADKVFAAHFLAFAKMREGLATKFRGRVLSIDERSEAAAHGMSLYVTHGTLLRKIFMTKNLLVINHFTPNLQNFFLYTLVKNSHELKNMPKFPLGIIENSWS